MKITIGTFNTQHCRDYAHFLKTGKSVIDIDLMADTIQKLRIDVCGLQEMRSLGKTKDYLDQPKLIAQRLGYHYYFAKAMDFEDGPYGNAIVSKYPILHAETNIVKTTGVIEEGVSCYENRSLLKAEIDVFGGLTVIVGHFGLSDSDRKAAVEASVKQIDELEESKRLVLMGDFNMQPNDATIAPIQKRLFDVSSLMPIQKGTFPSAVPQGYNQNPIKIDYIFTNGNVKVLSSEVHDIVAADHKIHTAIIEG